MDLDPVPIILGYMVFVYWLFDGKLCEVKDIIEAEDTHLRVRTAVGPIRDLWSLIEACRQSVAVRPE